MSVWAKYDANDAFNAEAGEAITDGQLLCIKSDGKAYLADSDGSSTYPCCGAAGTAVASGQQVSIVTQGFRNDGSSLTKGSRCYLSSTPGTMTQTAAGTEPQVVGYAFSATDWFFHPLLSYNVPN